MFITKAFLIAVLAAFQVRATPASVSGDLVVIGTKDSSFGPLVFYGLVEGANATVQARSALEERACGSNNVFCASDVVPNAESCNNLIRTLSGNTTIVGTRSICLPTSGSQCCVSWANNVPGLTENDLINAARATYIACVIQGFSGLTRNTNLNGVCTTQCLSNRPDGCL